MIDKIWAFLKSLSPSIWSTVIIVILLIIFIILMSKRIKKQDPLRSPKGLLLLIEILVSWINSFCEGILGKYWKKYAPFILTLAVFIFIANISGLFGLYAPTANVSITLALGVIVAFVVHGTCIKTQGIKVWLKSFLDPTPIMLPLNIISELLTPISMGMRLFGNIMSGSLIMALIYGAFAEIWISVIPVGYILSPFITPVFHAIFDIFFGAIQTYVFILLTAVFISGKLPEEI